MEAAYPEPAGPEPISIVPEKVGPEEKRLQGYGDNRRPADCRGGRTSRWFSDRCNHFSTWVGSPAHARVSFATRANGSRCT
jgi:hypothetical protein